MANNSRNSCLLQQDRDAWNSTVNEQEQQEIIFENGCANTNHDVMNSDEITVGLSKMTDIHYDDNTNSGFIWNIDENPDDPHHEYIDPSADVVLSELRSKTPSDSHQNSNSRYPLIDMNRAYNINDIQGNGEYSKDSNDPFNPTPLPRRMLTFPSRLLSAESAITTSTLNTVIGCCNHQQQQPQQESPQRRDSASASVGIVSIDDQTVQPNHYSLSSATRTLSASSSDSGAAGTTFPNPLDTEVSPTPINPYHNHRNSHERHRNENFCEVKQLSGKEEKDPKSVDEFMANELNRLSFQERESINEEIHGINITNVGVKESPELLTKSFQQLDIELRYLRPGCVAFDRSQRLFGTTTYLNTEQLRIMFLRCDMFDCKKAASRLCSYADLVHEIFGDCALQRKPYLSDLTDLEMRILESGGYQVLPGRDRAGRRILGNLAFDAPKEFGVLSRLRVSLYIIMSCLEDVETQRKGAVGISWWHNVSVDDFIIRKKVHEKVNCFPLRLGAYHCCIPSEVRSGRVGKTTKGRGSSGGVSSGMTHVIKGMAVLSVGPEIRPHLRFHTGSVVECMYALQSFGIHSDQIPVNSSSGKLKTKQHSKWLELCRLKEDSLKHHGHEFDKIIECPNQADVLFGRGRPIMRHPGNAVLRNVVQLKLEEYSSAKSKKQTTDVTWEVVRTLKGKYGARFLKEENINNDGLGWIEVSNETARQKVRIAFRDLRTKIMKTSAAEMNGVILKAKRKSESASPVTTPSAATSSTITTFTTPLPQVVSSQQIQEASSSTSIFLGMDGTDMKRRRRCF